MLILDDTLSFDSIDELQRFGQRPATANEHYHKFINSNEAAQHQQQGEWFGVASYGEVTRIFREGWESGVKRMMGNMSGIETPVTATSIKRRKIRGDNGDDYDWQAGEQGMHDVAWTRPVLRRVAMSRTVTLFCDLLAKSTLDTKADEFYWRGAAILFLADSLNEAGYNVQIIAGARQILKVEGRPVRQFNVVIKRPDMPLDLSALASSICLAGFTRVLVFSAVCAAEEKKLAAGLSESVDAVAVDGSYRVFATDQASARQAVNSILAAIGAV